ncbi:ROK family protein [Sphaerisporangium sp. TRM90804]|uniref:ROK family protein n=1 Tax=Sphaerisporangium sp. TRM90804 TaxID=3031113 RepID=UPI0024492537|nr:ROK family protein [Sphaerisporangium sp. TRM90804]MDH2428285.1 ROK family protein [Sphaerisporangium sp. TRM90804]
MRMKTYVVALDVGGTAMKGGLVTSSGEVLLSDRRATPRSEGPARVVEAIREFIDDLAAAGDGPPAGVGVAVPGLVTADAALYAANIGWKDVPAAEFTTLDVPVRLGHDVRTGGLAESVVGAGRSERDFLFLSIGTGIAGAIIVGGTPYGGSAGWGGEIGHIPVLPEGERCACGQIGCLETYASAASVARRYAERTSRTASTRPPASREVTPATAEDVVSLAMTGDRDAAAVWDEALEALSLALASYTLLLDPSSIVLGGGLSEAGPALFDPLAERLQEKLTWRTAPPLRPAALGTSAGMLGAALLGLQAAGFPDPGATWKLDVLRPAPVP